MDLSRLSNEDLEAIASGDMSKVSEKTLKYIVEQDKFAKELASAKPDTGFTGAFKAGKERLKGDIAALAGRTGIMNTEEAEQYKLQKEQLAEKIFTPTQEGWSEAPFTKFKETLGGSLPYTVAPLAAGIGAAALPVSAPVAGAIGLGGAGLASLGQFTGSNLSRQMQEDPSMRLGQTNLGAAATAALPQAALDVVSLRMIPGIGKIFGAAGKEITPELAKKIAEQGIAKTALSYGASGAKLAGVEGATEAGQQFFERLQAGLNLTDAQARDEYFENFIGGAVLGGALSVPGTAIERRQTVKRGAEMEEEQKRQAIIDRQNAQREAYLAEQQQLKQTSENLGVPQTLALPAPEEKIETIEEAVDPLINPLGRFKSTDLSPKEVAEVNKRRIAMGKPRIGRTFSIEDLSDVFKPEESSASEGVLGRLIAARTNFTGEDIPAQSLELAAQQRGLDTRTQGFRDFLGRVTGSEDLNMMSPPQRFAVAQALQNLKAGEESRILEAGISNAKHYTPDQYNDSVNGLLKEFKQMGNRENGKTSVLKLIGKYSGLTRERDQQRILDEAVKNGDFERSLKVSSTGNNIETFKPAEGITPLPGGMDIRKETFKQGEVPESYDVRAGSRVISSAETAEEAEKNAGIYEQNRQAQIVNLEKQIRKIESEMAKRDAELANDQALGNDQDNAFFVKSANYYGQNQVAQQSIAGLREQQQTFAEPVRIEPIGIKPIAKESYTFYEKDQPQVKFDSEEQAEQYGISRLDDKTLQQIIDSASAQKQTGRVKRYADLAQKELNDRNSIEEERGIAITTQKGLKGSQKRLEDLGLYTKEVQDNLEKLRQTLLPALKRYGLEKVALRVLNSIADGKADGYYVQQVMAIALDAKNPMGTLRHESIHALKELGAFTPQEWKILENKAKSEWVQKYIKDANLYEAYKKQYQEENGNLVGFEPYILEEAIAEAFKNFKVGNLPAGMIGNIWVRLNKMFEALRNSFNKLGFQTAEDIFTSVEEGKKPPTKEVGSAETKFAKRPLNTKEEIIADGVQRYADAMIRNRVEYDATPSAMTGRAYAALMKIEDGITERLKNAGVSTTRDDLGNREIEDILYQQIFPKARDIVKKAEKEKTDQLNKRSKYSLKSPLEDAFNYARTKNFKTNRDLKIDLQQTALDRLKEANIDIDNFDEDTINYLADLGVQDATYALKTNENAIGWYDVTVAKALNIISLLHPEIKTDPDAKFAFTWALAVTSNGIKVDKNFELAEQAYNYYKKNGVMPTNLQAGQAQGPINDGLRTFNQMVAKYGTDNTRKFMATEFTPKEIKELTGIEINGELASTKLLGASIIGPKIGNGFYSNLNGEFDRLTMDRWLMRTWGRWTGTLIEQNLPQIQKTRAAVSDMFKRFGNDPETKKNIEQVLKRKITKADLATVASRDSLAKDIAKQSVKPENRTVYNRTELGSDLRKATNNLSKYLDGQKEAPKTGTERNQIRTVFNKMLEDLRERGYDDLTMSDLQALMWYPERRLYDTAKESEATEGYKDDEAPDYANAAAKLVEENGIPKSDITKAVKETEKKYADRARGIQPNAVTDTAETSIEGKTRGFTENERAKFAEEFAPAKAKKFSLRASEDPAFKKWFGDSKVVDADGNPMVVYHATTKDFFAFDPKKLSKNTKHPTAKLGFFAAVNPESTDDFITVPYGIGKGTYEAGANVIPLYASIKNPVTIPSGQFVLQSMALQNMKKKDSDKFINDFIQSLRDEGHDGILITADKTGRGLAGGKEFSSDNWVALDPNQFKSAFNEQPTESNDIRFSLRAPETPEFKQWFGDSKIVDENGDPLPVYRGQRRDAGAESTDLAIRATPSFTDNKYVASVYSYAKSKNQYPEGSNIAPSYLRIESPIDLREFGNEPKPLIDLLEASGISGLEEFPDVALKILKDLDRLQEKTGFESSSYSGDYDYVSEAFDKLNNAINKNLDLDTLGSLAFDILEDLRVDAFALPDSPTVVEYVKEYNPRADGFIVRDVLNYSGMEMVGKENLKTLGKDGGYDAYRPFEQNQIKSAFNQKPTESKDVRYSLREFKMSDLPESGNYTLKAGTEIFHGAHKARAEEIEKGGKTLLLPSKVKQKSGGGNLYEGNLIWFGDKDLATGHSKSEVDTSKARYDAENGITREAGKAFSTITDRDYKLLNIWNYRLSQAEADQLNDALGLPAYKSVGEGDSPYSAAYRAHTNGKNVNRYQVERAGEFSDGLAMTAKTLGFDGVFDKTGMAFTAENGIRLGDEATPMQRFSLRSQLSDGLNERINVTTTKRQEKGYVERIIDAMSPTAITRIRQGLINKYESIERLSNLRGEKMGGDQLLAENSAIAAALQSDRAAGIAASSFRDGVPVLDKGYTYVTDMDGKVKGLIPILEPLMRYNDPYIFQTFQYYAGTRRGRRLDAEGREKTFTKEDIAYGKELETQFPEFSEVFNEYQKYNSGLVKYMMDTGVISAQEAKTWTENWDYIPFYRQIDGEKTAGPKVFSPIAGVAKPKKLKGSEAPLDDFMETIVRNARAAIEAGLKNEAARRVIRDVTDFGLGEKLPSSQAGTDVVSVKENGITAYYRVADPLLVESLKGLNLPQLPFMDFLSAPANLLRNFVTKDPGFIIANLGRDSMQAWITSGTDMKPLVDTFKQFGRELLNQSPEAYALAKSGLTGYDFAGDVKSTAQQVEKELRKRTGTRTRKEQALLPITAFWDMLEKGSHASDMATRAEVYKRTLERTDSEAEAFYQAMEVMNFSRKGNSAIIRILSAMIPFFNARVQGLDVLYRTGFGKAAMENKEKIQKAFIFRSMVLLGSSVMYWGLMQDEDEYKKLSKEERDNYWIIPAITIGDKPFRFPIPFELGVLFKVLPERALEYSFGTDTGKDLKEALFRNAMSTLSFNPIPQAALPLVENATNHSFFTGEPIIGKGVEGLAPQLQFGAGTSEFSKKLGKELDYSPQKIDNLIRGYTGTLGSYAMMMIDSALTQEGDTVKATKRMEQLPVIKRFFAGDMGNISAYYDLKEEVDTVVQTVNTLQRTGNTDDLKEYLSENKQLYALKGYVGVLDKSMKQLSQMSRLINASKTMTADEKRESLDRIHDAQLKLTERVRILRKQRE
jgi:hypothetical protein